jgi:predicted nucleic acid-binding protein
MESPSISYREEPAGLEPIWHRLAALPSASPKAWMDAYLAAFASAAQLELVTFDHGFSKFAGVNVTILAPATPTQIP